MQLFNLKSDYTHMMKRFKLLSMAALVALSVAACDEGEDGLSPDVTGSITGTVTVDGTGRAGVTVTLSNGQTATTSATGAYTFNDVAAGAHTLTISGFPAGSQCQATSQAVVIATAGQSVPANFSCSTVRNSSIVVTVTGGSGPLPGVTVTLSGAGTGTTPTSTAGVASFTGLAAGTYTVAISGVPAGQLCANPSQSTTVPAGETRSVAFTCTSSTTGSITGRLFLDENNKNNVFDGATLEDNLMVANVAITLEGPTIGVTQTTQTDANGNFSFTNLSGGQYNVTIDSDDPDLPNNVSYGLNSETIGPITLAAGGTATANFPFDIVDQTILVYAFLGRDANAANNVDPSIPTGVAPVQGVIIDLFPTKDDADNNTNRLGRDTTNASGEVQFTFSRALDTSPGVGGPDQIVFARIRNPLPAGLVRNGEQEFEIRYNPRHQTTMAPDTFDLLNPNAIVSVDVVGINGEELAGWGVRLFDDTTAAAIGATQTNADGRATFVLTTAVNQLPDHFFIRLANAQAAAGTHDFQATPTAGAGSVAGRYLRYTHTGTVATNDTVDVGDLTVKFLDTDVIARVYRERDDTVGYTGGDNTASLGGIMVRLRWRQTGATADSIRTVAPAGDGSVTFLNVPTGQTAYRLIGLSSSPRVVLKPDTITGVGSGTLGDLQGGSPQTFVCTSGAKTLVGCGTFAFKFDNGHITGRVRSATGNVGIEGVQVRVMAHPRTIQGVPLDTVVTTNSNGRYRVDAREGLYIITVPGVVLDANGDSLWAIVAPTVDTVDVDGNADTAVAHFDAVKMNTQIQGVVVNDRDLDGNTIDPGEALANVEIQLYRDNVGAATVNADSLVATTTTNASGAYTFGGLREGRYVVRANSTTSATVLRGYAGTGTVTNTAVVTTTAIPAAPADNLNNVDRVGHTSPDPLPNWDYSTSTANNVLPSHFTFLYSTGSAVAVVQEGATPVSGMTMTLRRCETAAAAPSPPATGVCTSYFPGAPVVNVNTNAQGRATFTGLLEGVYEVSSNPSTAGYASTVPATMLYTISGNQDVETGQFQAVP